MAQIAKVRPLRRVGDALTRCSVGGDPLLQSGVVQSTPLPQQEVEGWRLGPVRIQAVLVGAAHDWSTNPLIGPSQEKLERRCGTSPVA